MSHCLENDKMIVLREVEAIEFLQLALVFLRVVSHTVACEVNSDWSFSNLLDSVVFSDFKSVIVFFLERLYGL